MSYLETEKLFTGKERDWQVGLLRPTDRCFLCGEQIVTAAIVWLGADERGQQLWLHPPCAEIFGEKLIHDATNAGADYDRV